MATANAYELRRGEDILSTGRLTAEHDVAPGDELAVAGVVARVKEVGWTDWGTSANARGGAASTPGIAAAWNLWRAEMR